MKKILLVLFIFTGVGCEDRLMSYWRQPETILQDPHFMEYQQQSERLEYQYLYKQISYVEYRERKAQLDQDYEQQVHDREAIIRGEQ